MHSTRSGAWEVLVLAWSGPAHAGGKSDLEQFAASNTAAIKNGELDKNHNNFHNAPALCTKAVEAGNAEGLKATDTFSDGEGNTVLWKRAPDVCTQYARLHAVAATFAAVEDHLKFIPMLRGMSGTDGKPDPSMRGDAFREHVARSKACVKTIDDAIAKGVAADVTIAYGDNMGGAHRITLPEAKKICADLVVWAGDAAVADDKRIAEEIAALKAKYGKLGITGDRLNYLVKYGHRPVFGKGCGELAGKGLKTSPAFYDLQQDDLAWIVYKTEFKGDKQVRYTSNRFRKDGGWKCK